MAFSLRQIEVVRAVLRAGTVTQAARHLGVSQPAISRVLKHAEDRLGLKLFDRRGGRLRPTAELQALYPEIERIWDDLSYVQRAAEDLRTLRGGRLAIAAIPSIAATVLADAVGHFRADRPGLTLHIRTALNYEVLDLVLARQVELGFAFDARRHPDLDRIEIARTRLVCVMPARHALAARKAIAARDLRAEPLIAFSRSLAIGEAVERAFAAAGELQRVAVEVGQSFLACSLVQAGAGLAVVDGLVTRHPIAAGLAVRPFVPDTPLALHALQRRGETPSLAAAAVLERLCPPAATSQPRKAP